MTNIAPGAQVRYKADPNTVGLVFEVVGENVRVFVDNSMRLIPVSDLEPVPPADEMSPADFRNALTGRRLEHPLTDQMLSYRASRTNLYYHQFLPLKKLLESPDQRLLIADEVGTGKTIEAGLIWAELESRAAHGLDNVWIICPKSLLDKWRDEMLQRFDLRLEILSPHTLRQALTSLERDGVLPAQFAKSVVNIELIRASDYLSRLERASIEWDLVIFDEAHHLRNPETLSHDLAKLVCERSKSAVFLTATPLQTGLNDIVHLMEALGVDVAEDPELLVEQMGWDMRLNDWIRLVRSRPAGWRDESSRILRELETTAGGHRPGWSEFAALANNEDMNDRSRRTVVVQSARDIQTLSPYMTRTLRSDVDENRPTREARTRTVEFSGEEEAFYKEIYRVCQERAKAQGSPEAFVTQMPERRTSSCLPSVASEIIAGGGEDEDEEQGARFSRRDLARLKPLAEAALKSKDMKFEMLCETLEDAFRDLGTDRVMVFSIFRGTLRYLASELRNRGYSLELMYGPTPARDEDCRPGEKSRTRIEREFRNGEFQILLASEVAGEGLDFEHCNVVINYDLPWNPMRVEQRIGRCDRIGQRSDKVYIRSLASVGTIEERILSRLYERLDVFERALGDMEVILGEQISQFERDLFNRGLSPSQQNERLEMISQIVENTALQREAVTNSSVISLQGRQLMESDQAEIRDAESRSLSPSEIAEFVYAALESHLPGGVRRVRGLDAGFSIRATTGLKDALSTLRSDYPASSGVRGEINQFRKRVDAQDGGWFRVTFAEPEDGVEFAHVRHPLALLARSLTREQSASVLRCVGALPSTMLDKPTALVWAIGSLEGYTNRVELMCASVDCNTGEASLITISEAQKWTRELSPVADDQTVSGVDMDALVSQAEQALSAEFERIRAAFNSKNDALTSKAKQAVVSHNERKIQRNNRRLDQDDLPDRLRSLYSGWNRNIRADVESKLAEIDRKSGVISSLTIIGVAVAHPQS